MKKTKKSKKLTLFALLATASVGIGVGGTFALFTDVAEAQVAVTAGKVDIEGALATPELYSAKADTNGELEDELGNKYTWQDGWVNGGTATVDATTGKITMDRMTPGDRADITASFVNNSNVKILYRYILKAVNPTDYLAAGMKITIDNNEYEGLLSYRSAWKTLDPSETNVEIGDLSFHLPISRGNIFQGLSTNYTLRIEAVQGNAAVSDTAGVELAGYLPQETVVGTNLTTTMNYYSNPGDVEPTTKVDLTFTPNTGVDEGDTVVLGVTTRDTVENAGTYTVSDGDLAAAAIDLNLLVNGVQKTENFLAVVNTYIAKGLTNVNVNYDGSAGQAFNGGGHKEDSADAVDEAGDYFYDPATGLLVFCTDHFSEYYVTADNIVAYNRDTTQVYTSLDTALAEAVVTEEKTERIALLKDIERTAYLPITKNTYIDGNNHNIKFDADRGIRIGESDVKVELHNLGTFAKAGSKKFQRAIQVDSDKTNVTLDLDNVKAKATYYTINFCADSTVTMNIKNCELEGWAALNVYSDGFVINVDNSILRGVNDKGQSPSNNFATVCIEGDTTHQTTLGASNNKLNITNSQILSKTYSSNYQCHVGFNDNSISNIIRLERCKLSYIDAEDNETNELYCYDRGTDNSLVVDGEVVDFDLS